MKPETEETVLSDAASGSEDFRFFLEPQQFVVEDIYTQWAWLEEGQLLQVLNPADDGLTGVVVSEKGVSEGFDFSSLFVPETLAKIEYGHGPIEVSPHSVVAFEAAGKVLLVLVRPHAAEADKVRLKWRTITLPEQRKKGS